MFNKDDPFRTKSKEELKKEADEKKRLEEKLAKAAQAARTCLNSNDFLKYKEYLHDAREDAIKLLKMNSDPDPIKFAFFAKALLNKIDAFDMLIEEVEKDTKKGAKSV